VEPQRQSKDARNGETTANPQPPLMSELVHHNPDPEKQTTNFESLRQAQSREKRVEQWLAQFGFQYNPFAATDSERDEHLNSYFVEHADFERTVRVENRIIFAGIGEGKTAIRLRLQALYRDTLAYERVFAFSYLLPSRLADHPPPSFSAHLPYILTAAVRHLFVLFALSGSELPELQRPEMGRQFASFFDYFYGTTTWRTDLEDAIQTLSLDRTLQTLGDVYDDLSAPRATGSVSGSWLVRWLALLQHLPADPSQVDFAPIADPADADYAKLWEQFYVLLLSAGIHHLLILVDGIDTKPSATNRGARPERLQGQTENDLGQVERMVKLAAPLLQAQQNQALGEQTFMKIFTPRELFLPLASCLPREQPADIIHWDYARLKKLLTDRLSTATNNAITQLAQLVEPDVHELLESNLIIGAKSSPRNLIHCINEIFKHHVSLTQGQLPGKLSRMSLARVPYARYHGT
jgi:hypothetical protein